MKSLVDIDISNKNLVVRVDMNVPIRDKKIQDPTRIKACLPTINYALEKNCKVLLISHLGRPTEGSIEDKYSLEPVSEYLSEILDEPVSLEKDISFSKLTGSSKISDKYSETGSREYLSSIDPSVGLPRWLIKRTLQFFSSA